MATTSVEAESTTNIVQSGYNYGDRFAGVLNAGRLRERMHAAGISQAELARRIRVSQQAIGKLAAGGAYGSKHLHRIARELGTTPAYLTGETDDPTSNVPDGLELSADEHRLIAIYRRLPDKDRAALKLLVARMGGKE
jgi:transcriptional regulator with XRE-family HTH domain